MIAIQYKMSNYNVMIIQRKCCVNCCCGYNFLCITLHNFRVCPCDTTQFNAGVIHTEYLDYKKVVGSDDTLLWQALVANRKCITKLLSQHLTRSHVRDQISWSILCPHLVWTDLLLRTTFSWMNYNICFLDMQYQPCY